MKTTMFYMVVLFAALTAAVGWAEDPDYGNDSANASAITADGSTVAGVLAASDEDWFTYVPTANTKVSFTLRNIDYNWKSIYIFQDTGWVDLIQATYTNVYHDINGVTCFFETDDPIYIRVSGSQGGYEVTVTELTTHAPDGFANTHDVAEVIVVDDPAVIGTISADELDHVDWFEFSTTALHQYRIRLSQLNNTNVNYSVYAADGVTSLYTSRDMTLTSWYGDNFKIKVYGDTNRLGNYYELIVEDVATFTDPHGNTPAEASELTVGVDYDSSIEYNSTIYNDEDWFVFTPAGNALYQVTVTNYDYNWKSFYIYQDKGFIDLTQATYNNAYYASASRTVFFDGTEPCYIKMNGATGTYKLRVDQVAIYPPDSYGQNCGEATPITIDAPATIGTISPDQTVNQDWFVFNTTALHKYRITLTQADNSDTAFYLYNADCSTQLHGRTRDITVVSWFGENFKILVDGYVQKLGNQYNLKVEEVDIHEDDFPNLSTQAATINKDGTVYDGVVNFDANVQADQDWMKFVAPIDGSYEFTFRNFEYNWKSYYVYSIDEANILHQVFYRNAYFNTDVYGRELTAGTHYIMVYGGTGAYQISVLSPEPLCGDLDHPYPPGDANHDCYVNMADLAMMAANWLTCTDPNPPCAE
ncbi:MAG: hypothetical protein KAS23_16005 [Anaerohalosphaera sp.]|nr:hypothetical protein [Anaerohalosphaera sp.]